MGVANAISSPYMPNWVEITRRALRQAAEKVRGGCSTSLQVNLGRPSGVYLCARWCASVCRQHVARQGQRGRAVALPYAAHAEACGRATFATLLMLALLPLCVANAQGRLAGEGMQLTGEAGPLGESDEEGEGAMAGEGGQWRQQQASPTARSAAD